jgi:hypothetical protein
MGRIMARCSRMSSRHSRMSSVAQDGVAGRVNYDANHRFYLDGQRLMALNGGTYGLMEPSMAPKSRVSPG